MARVTGMGCAATALIGAFAAVESSAVDAAAYGMALSGIAGEIAASRAAGPGSMQVHFLDALASVTHDDVSGRLRMEEQGDMPS